MAGKMLRSEYERTAYADGRKACREGRKGHERPNYSDWRDRDAFTRGWRDEAEAIAGENAIILDPWDDQQRTG